MSRMGGQALTSTAAAASLDRSNLQMSCVVIKQAERLTCGQRVLLTPVRGASGLPAPLRVLWVGSSLLQGSPVPVHQQHHPQGAEILLPELEGRGHTASLAWSQPSPRISEREVPALGSRQGGAWHWDLVGQARHWGPGRGEAGAPGQGYLHDHLHGRQRRCDVLWVWGADGDGHAARVEAAVERRDEVYP